jgi:mxaA protein
MRRKEKQFFFEKKNQKTFALVGAYARYSRVNPTRKVFCFFFSKKKYFLPCLAALLTTPAAAQVLSVTLQPRPRDFGYFIGDTMTLGTRVRLAPGTVLDAASLPAPGAVAAAIDLRRVTVSRQGDTLLVQADYQTFVAPEEAMQVRVPGYMLAFRNGAKTFQATIPPWSFYTSPFRHERAAVTDPAVLRPDPGLAPLDTEPYRFGCAAAFALAVAALLVLARLRGWRPRLARRRPPFAHAVRQLGGADQISAMLALHRAFDATAGRALLAEDVEPFLLAHPVFQPLRHDIESFFSLSRASFFGRQAASDADLMALVHALARRLRRAERRA